MRRTTVLLADDHAIVQEGLARLLKDGGFEVVGAVGDGGPLIDAARRLRPDVIVMDLSMPGLSGLDVLARLKTEGIASKVIVLTMHKDANLATIAMRGGAAGFLLKESAGEELFDCHPTGTAGPRLPHARADQGRHGAHGRLVAIIGAAADAAPA